MDGVVTERQKQELFAKEGQFLERVNAAGHELFQRGAYAVAARLFERCYRLRPRMGAYAVNYGSALWHLGEYEEAERILTQQVIDWPSYDDGRENYGKVLSTLGRFDEAEAQFNEILRRAPDNHRVKMQRAFTRLDRGDWEGGLEDYEARLLVRDYQKFPPEMPVWNGEDLTGKTLYVQAEQGAGDTFLFSRYLAWVKATWPTCRIKFCAHHRLITALWYYVSQGLVEYLPEGVPWAEARADYGIYLASLPRLHKTRPATVPLDPGLIEQRCSPGIFKLPNPELGHPLKIGICWTGNPEMKENSRRSVPVTEFLKLSGDPRYLLYSFQVGNEARQQMLDCMAHESICDISPAISAPHGFVETGRALMECDVVITVCTVTAHLAGCMGVPTWLLLSKEPYWIWGREGDTTPWYPSMRLFRQQEFGKWGDVFARVTDELAKLYEKTTYA